MKANKKGNQAVERFSQSYIAAFRNWRYITH